MGRIGKLKRQAINEANKRVLKEQGYTEHMWPEQYEALHDIHDDILYLTPEYSNQDESTKTAKAIELYYHILDIIYSRENATVSPEAKEIINRINFDLSALQGLSDRVIQLYTNLTEEEL
jgi:hypothetical protein